MHCCIPEPVFISFHPFLCFPYSFNKFMAHEYLFILRLVTQFYILNEQHEENNNIKGKYDAWWKIMEKISSEHINIFIFTTITPFYPTPCKTKQKRSKHLPQFLQIRANFSYPDLLFLVETCDCSTRNYYFCYFLV